MRYFLQVVKTYTGRKPIYYTSGDLADYELDQDRDILSRSSSIQFKTTVYQARADFFRVGKLTIRLNASLLRWIPRSGWLQSDRDHLLAVKTDDAASVIWKGYAVQVKYTKDAGAEWVFASLYDRLDDVQIEGDDDDMRAAIPAQDIIDEVREQLDIFPVVDASAYRDVFRPSRNTSARDFLPRLFNAEGRLIVPDADGDLEVREIAPRQATFDPATDLTIRSEDLLALKVQDDKEFMFNTITYQPHGGDELVYQGELETYQEPGNFIFRYGRREIKMDFEHLSAADALAVAEEWQGRLLRPKVRLIITIPNPARQVLLLDRVKLELDDVADIPIPLWGEFVVTAFKINLAADSVQLEIEDTRETT